MRPILHLVIFLCCFSHAAISQLGERKVSITARDIPLSDVLDRLSNNHNISFSYCKDRLSLNKLATITKTKTSLKVVLDELFISLPLEYKEIGGLVVLKNVPVKTKAVSVLQTNKTVLKPSFPLGNTHITPDNQRKPITSFVFVNGIGEYQFYEGKSEPIIILTKEPARQHQADNTKISVQKHSASSVAGLDDMDFRMPVQIVRKAFEMIEENFFISPHLLKGFYREIHLENDKTISMVDADVDIIDKGYRPFRGSKKRLQEKVRLNHVRASRSYMKNGCKSDFQDFNSLTGILRWNRVKYRDPNVDKNLGKRHFKLDSIIKTVNGSLYVISSSTPSWRYESKITYYINVMTNAFQKVEYRDSSSKGFYLPQQWRFSDDPAYEFKAKSSMISYEFGHKEGKMFLKNCYEKSFADIYSNESRSVEWEFGCIRRLVISDVTKTINRSIDSKAMNSNKSLEVQSTKYDKGFWDNYPFPEQVSLDSGQIHDLEWEMPLTEQFEENGLVAEKPGL